MFKYCSLARDSMKRLPRARAALLHSHSTSLPSSRFLSPLPQPPPLLPRSLLLTLSLSSASALVAPALALHVLSKEQTQQLGDQVKHCDKCHCSFLFLRFALTLQQRCSSLTLHRNVANSNGTTKEHRTSGGGRLKEAGRLLATSLDVRGVEQRVEMSERLREQEVFRR
eukprot:767543-Hanusia_phi.AAC.3